MGRDEYQNFSLFSRRALRTARRWRILFTSRDDSSDILILSKAMTSLCFERKALCMNAENTDIHSRLLRVKTRSLHSYSLQRRFMWWNISLLKLSLTCFTWSQSIERSSLWSTLLALDVQWSQKAKSITERVTATFSIIWQFTHMKASQRKMINHKFFILRFW